MNAIELAVQPLKQQAIDRSVQRVQNKIDSTLNELEAAGWDARVVAPYPHGNMSRIDYRNAEAYYRFVRSITKWTKSSLSMREPEIVVRDQERIDYVLQQAIDYASAQYDAYVAKLNNKIGEVIDAKLIGNNVWDYSILQITKADGSIENWKTQIIVNVSSLGKLFNQWPTRKMK